MYKPTFQRDRNNIPILKRIDIDSIAENLVRDFQPEVFEAPIPVNVDAFIERYLQLTLEYQYLSHNGCIMGMTVFGDTNQVVIYDNEKNQAEYFTAKEGTIIIDRPLSEEVESHRYRFTAAHETGHWIFHKYYFDYNADQLSFFQLSDTYTKCRSVDPGKEYYSINENWDDNRWLEWQADSFSASFLLPETAVRGMYETLFKTKTESFSYAVESISDRFEVSKEATRYRLIGLGYGKKKWSEEQLSMF